RGKPGPSADAGHTLTTIAESPLRPGLLYAGSDDGRVHVSPDGGRGWRELTYNVPGVPSERCVARLECSHFAEDTVYLALDRHRHDDRDPYLFRSTDRGQSWVSLAATSRAGAPESAVAGRPLHRPLVSDRRLQRVSALRVGGGLVERAVRVE